jgi:hypothetical protein
MKKIVIIGLLFFLSIASVACSTKASFIPSPEFGQIAVGSKFSVGSVVDETGFSFSPGDPDAIVLTDTMEQALKKALAVKDALLLEVPDEDHWTINVTLVAYAPGNAFARWVLPGLGETKLHVVANIVNKEGNVAAKIPVERSIAAGGGYTIGAWKYVFDEVALTIASYLTDPKLRAGTLKT